MRTPLPASAHDGAAHWASLALRLAQRAFSALIEESSAHAREDSELRLARLRSQARRTWIALSAEDQARLSRWLARQTAGCRGERSLPQLLRVDGAFAGIEDASRRACTAADVRESATPA